MAGPTCGRMLADMGADVVKVEPVTGGDATRGFRPPDLDGESAAFMMLNRNKRGVALDLKSEGGLEVARRLVERADVLIENHRTGTMDRLGLGYDRLRESNPGLIYCEISGFGRTGPMAHLGGFDLISQGYSGIMSVTGEGEGRPPVKCAPPPHRYHRRHPRCDGYSGRIHRATRDGQRPEDRHVPLRGWCHAVVLAGGRNAGHRRLTRAAGFGPSVDCSLSGFRDVRRVDHGRRIEPGDLAPTRRDRGASRARRGSPLPGKCGSHATRGRAQFNPG